MLDPIWPTEWFKFQTLEVENHTGYVCVSAPNPERMEQKGLQRAISSRE